MKSRILPLAWCFVAAALVAGNRAAVRGAGQRAAPAFDSISYHDSGGFAGGGTGKSLSLFGDGKIETYTRAGQRVVTRLQPQDLVVLSTAIAAVDWPRIEHGYRARGAADLIVRDLTVVVRGVTYETHADSLAKVPQPLLAVFDRLDEIYRRARDGSDPGNRDVRGGRS